MDDCGGEMDVSGTLARLGRKIVDGGDDALGIEMPLDEETIGGDTAVERAGSDAVEIGEVVAGDGAETVDVEVCVFGFERIEGPLDEANAAEKSVFALKELELTADAAVAMREENGGHMGMEIRGAVVEADVGFGEADHGVTVEGAEDLAAGVIGDDKGGIGFGFEFGIAPDVAGDLNAALEFVDGVERTDGDIRGHGTFEVISYQFLVFSTE